MNSWRVVLVSLLFSANHAVAKEPAEGAEKKNVPKCQYESEGIRISAAAADEPRVPQFDASSLASAVDYLEGGALAWVRERGCVNCHTTGPYMTERPALSSVLGFPNAEVQQNFVKDIPLRTRHKSYATLLEVETELLKLNDKPVQIVWGGKDFCFNKHFFKQWCQLFPKAEIHLHEKFGHYILEDGGDTVLEQIKLFLTV